MGFQYLADSFGFCCLGFMFSWWRPRQANEGVASLPSIFSENHDYKKKICLVVNKYVPIFRGLDAHGGSKLRTDTHNHTHIHTHTHGTTTVTIAVRMRAKG